MTSTSLGASRNHCIRAITHADAEQLADLHVDAFGKRDNTRDQVARHYSQVLHRVLDDPRPGAPVNQSSCVAKNGRIVAMIIGCPIEVNFAGDPAWAIVTTSFCASPNLATPRALRKMLIGFRDGPQLLSVADRANEVGGRAADAFGGRRYPQHSLRFGRVLNPGTSAASAVLNRKPVAPAVQRHVFDRLAKVVSASSRRLFESHLGVRAPTRSLKARPLNADDVVNSGQSMVSGYSLRPSFATVSSTEFQWNELAKLRSEGDLHRIAIVDHHDKLVGWYLLHQWPTGTAEVVQLICSPGYENDVIAVMLQHAQELGVGTLYGDAPSSLLLALGDAGAYFTARGSTTIVHSHTPAIYDAFASGEAFLTGLEGEYPLMLARATSNAH